MNDERLHRRHLAAIACLTVIALATAITGLLPVAALMIPLGALVIATSVVHVRLEHDPVYWVAAAWGLASAALGVGILLVG